MPVSLLAPLFALGAAAIVIPLLVHLVHKERKDALAFPSLMFLRRTPYPFSARQRIRDWVLFVLRSALIVLAALAFARPVIARRQAAAAAAAGGQEIVVLLDRSFSMRYSNRWQRARAEVRRVIDGVGNGDRATIIPFDRRASAVNEATSDRAMLRSALDSIGPSDEGTRLAPAVALAQRVLSSSDLPHRTLVVVSDFQRTSWDLTDDVQLPPGTEIRPIDVSGEVRDRAVRSVEIRRTPGGDASRVLVSGRVVNVGRAQRGIGVRLEVGGREADRKSLDLPEDGGATITFANVAVPNRPVAAKIVIDGDELTGDDVFHFLLTRAPTIPVLLVEHRDALPDRGVFVSRALEIGDQPAFDVLARRSDRVAPADLAGRRLVILADAGIPIGVGAQRLERFVSEGGGLINALGERTSARTWPATAKALIPGTIAEPADRLGERGAVLGFVDRRHQALAVFSGSRSGDLSAARFFRYRPIDTTEGVLARFDDGSAALTEHRLGTGRILTWASTFDGYWNDLPRQPVFLPFLHQLSRYAAAYREQKRAYAVGEAVQPADLVPHDRQNAANVPTRWTVLSPSGKRISVGGGDGSQALELREAGIHEVRPSGVPNAEPMLVAANVDPVELDFATFDVSRLTNALQPPGSVATRAVAADPQATLAEREQKQSMWWYVLAVAAIILFTEGLLARRTSAQRLLTQ
jgi:hypothetical protein